MAAKKSSGKRTAKKSQSIGFKKLSSKLARQGVRNPDALAASIGRKKFGKAGMARKAAAGKRKAARRRKG